MVVENSRVAKIISVSTIRYSNLTGAVSGRRNNLSGGGDRPNIGFQDGSFERASRSVQFSSLPSLFSSLSYLVSLCLSPPKSPWRDHSSCLSILMQAQRINKPDPLGHKFLRGAGPALCISRVCARMCISTYLC